MSDQHEPTRRHAGARRNAWTPLSVIGAVVLLLAGCGSDDSPPAVAGSSTATTTEADPGGESVFRPEGSYGLEDPFRDGNFAFKVLSMRQVPRIQASPTIAPARGAALVRVELITVNASSQPVIGPICQPGYAGVVLVDDEDRNYSAALESYSIAGTDDLLCQSPTQPGLERRIVLAFQIPEAVAPSIAGLAVWDPTEQGDETGDGSFYFVDARL